MSNNDVIIKLIKYYINLNAELEIAYRHRLSSGIISSLHYEMNNLKKTLYKHQIDHETIKE